MAPTQCRHEERQARVAADRANSFARPGRSLVACAALAWLLAPAALVLALGCAADGGPSGQDSRLSRPQDRGRSAAAESAAGPAAAQPTAPAPAGGDTAALGPPGFSGSRAFAHLEALSAIGPRVSGTPGAEAARDYLRSELEAIGAEVREWVLPVPVAEGESVESVHLAGVLPGDSPDVFVLGAAYDTLPVDGFELVAANGSASGPALVLELGRALAARPRPYTVWLLFIDADSLPAAPGRSVPARRGSRTLATALDQEGTLDGVRLALFFERVADPDLGIARDLRSHRVYREMLFREAAALDFAEAFPADAAFSTPSGPHRAFLKRGLRRTVAVIDDRFGGAEPPGALHQSPDDTPESCSPESLGAVGTVSLVSVDRIATRLTKIDRFVQIGRSEVPEPAEPEPAELPMPGEASAPDADEAPADATEAEGAAEPAEVPAVSGAAAPEAAPR